MSDTLNFKDINGFIRRRKIIFLWMFIAIFIIGAYIAYILPAIYRSQATILIVEQQIPEKFVLSVSSYVERRIEEATQKVLSRSNLLDINDKFNPYSYYNDILTEGDIVRRMRKDIEIEIVNVPVVNLRSGKSMLSAISFNISYKGRNPATVRDITNVLSKRYIKEDLKKLSNEALATINFFQQEIEGIKTHISDKEKDISNFKLAHMGELPEQNRSNFHMVRQLERELQTNNTQLRILEEKKINIQSQLSMVEPLTPIVINGEKVGLNPAERLKRLHLELSSLQASLSNKHPDIKKLKNEIAKLEGQVGKSDDSTSKIKRLNEIKGKLSTEKTIKGSKHPDVKKLEKEVDILSKEVNTLITKEATIAITKENPDNPFYINLQAQLTNIDSEIKALLRDKSRLVLELAEYNEKIQRAPLIEKKYNELTRDYEALKHKYMDINNKLLEAGTSYEMHKSQRGERFQIKEPAFLPAKPYQPNRIMILLLSFIIAAGIGFGFAALREGIDNSIKATNQATNITGVPVLSVIPLLESGFEKSFRNLKIIILFISSILLIGIAMYYANRYFGTSAVL